jgi:hypothetical protein
MSERRSGKTVTTRGESLGQAATVTAAVVAGAGLLRSASAAAPVWTSVPDHSWASDAPVYLDLREYCLDADGDTKVS